MRTLRYEWSSRVLPLFRPQSLIRCPGTQGKCTRNMEEAASTRKGRSPKAGWTGLGYKSMLQREWESRVFAVWEIAAQGDINHPSLETWQKKILGKRVMTKSLCKQLWAMGRMGNGPKAMAGMSISHGKGTTAGLYRILWSPMWPGKALLRLWLSDWKQDFLGERIAWH